MNCPYNARICSKCKTILIACEINFKKTKKGKYGLASQCKKCEKQYREEHKEEIANKKKQYYENNKDKVSKYNKQYREEHKEEKKERNKQYYENNKDKAKEYNKQYYENNKEYYAEYGKQYYKNNKDKILEYSKQYKQEHKEKYKEYNKKYHKNNPHIKFNQHNKRRNKLENQGKGITEEQWLEMMLWFDFRCAYSNEYIGGDSKYRTIDHIIALDNGGLNEIWNCVPMYKSYNSSKNNREMEDWYRQQEYFNEERLAKIYEWCEYAYDKWGCNAEQF